MSKFSGYPPGLSRLDRRRLLQSMGGIGLAMAGGSLLAGCGSLSRQLAPSLGEAPLETTRLRVYKAPSICVASQYVAEDLLRAEGFTDLHYVECVCQPGMAHFDAREWPTPAIVPTAKCDGGSVGRLTSMSQA